MRIWSLPDSIMTPLRTLLAPAVHAWTLAIALLAVAASGAVHAQGDSSNSRSATRAAPVAGSTPGREPLGESSPGRSREGAATSGTTRDDRSRPAQSRGDMRSADRERENDRRSRTPSN
jgi:hypothetical protein